MAGRRTCPAAASPDRDLVELVRAACQADPGLPALIFEDGVSVSRGRLWAETESFAGYLSARIEPGDRVAVMMPNRAEFMVAWLAVAACRGILVALNPAARSHDAGHVLRDSGGHGSRSWTPPTRSCSPGCSRTARSWPRSSSPPPASRAGSAATPAPGLPDRPAAARGDLTNIFYTSGTTGPPKGCAVGHDYWVRFAELMAEQFSFTAADRMICCLQFFYNDPPWMLLLALTAGTSMVAMRRFSVSRYWQVVRDHDVTVLFGIASTASLLLKAPPSDAGPPAQGAAVDPGRASRRRCTRTWSTGGACPGSRPTA